MKSILLRGSSDKSSMPTFFAETAANGKPPGSEVAPYPEPEISQASHQSVPCVPKPSNPLRNRRVDELGSALKSPVKIWTGLLGERFSKRSACRSIIDACRNLTGSLALPQEKCAVWATIVEPDGWLNCAFAKPISAPFHPAGFSPEDWKTFQSTVEALGAKFVRVHVVAQPHTVLQRIQSRGAPRDAAKLRDWEEYRSQWDTELPNCLAVVLDNSAGLDTLDLNVAKLAKLIRIEQALDRDWCLH